MRIPFGNPTVAERIKASRAEYDREQERRDRESAKHQRKFELDRAARDSFLRETDAAAVPPQLYAAWLAVWVSQGGKINYHNKDNLWQPGRVDFGNSFTYWVPRRPFRSIPTGYGACKMNLLVVPSITGGDFHATSGDLRQGWEYGHSKVLRLEVDDNGIGMYASTNQPDSVESFIDVERCIEDQPLDMRSIGAAVMRLGVAQNGQLELPR